jgi:tRNA (mo5U34)-methyltransferase
MRYLRNVVSVTRDIAIIETHVDGNDYGRPMMVFYPGETLNADSTSFWGPNRQCVVDMLCEVGFARVDVVHEAGTRLTAHAHRR